MRLFSSLPISIINVHERDREGRYVPKIETKVVDDHHELFFDIFANPWTPILRDKKSSTFRVAKMVALPLEGDRFSPEEAISQFNDVSHMIVKQQRNASVTLILPLREGIRNEREYLSVVRKVATKCRTLVTAADLKKYLPPCSELVGVNYRSKNDIAQMLLGIS